MLLPNANEHDSRLFKSPVPCSSSHVADGTFLTCSFFWRAGMQYHPSCFKSKEHRECPFIVNLAWRHRLPEARPADLSNTLQPIIDISTELSPNWLSNAPPLTTKPPPPLRRWVSFHCEWEKGIFVSNGAFPLHGTVRFGTARYGTVRLSSGRFAFPPQFSTAIEWAGLFTRRYNCAASTAVTSS